MAMLYNLLYDTLYHATPIILCVLGGLFAYKANVLNIALEGMMLSSAFVATLVYFLTENLSVSILAALLCAMAEGLLFSLLGITLRGNVIIIGLGINLITGAFSKFVLKKMALANISLQSIGAADFKLHIPILKDIPLLSAFSGHPPITYIAFMFIPIIFILLYQTRFGIYVRVVGENEEAAVSLGISHNAYKYAAILLGGIFCGLAGINLSLERMAMYTPNMTAGRGFIAIAAIYCGQGNPISCAFYAILFGIARALSINLSIYAGPAAGLFDIIPYFVMIAVLAIVSYQKNREIHTRGYKLS